MLDETFLAKQKTALLERQGQIEADLQRLSEEMRDLGTEQAAEHGGLGNHLAEDGSSVSEQQRILRVESDLTAIKRDIEGALGRMDEGTYGKCARCGKPINKERLKAFPYVPNCITCQTELERFGG